MYHRDYTDFPEDFAHEMTYKRYCKAIDEREKAEDARYTLENMVYPHKVFPDIRFIYASKNVNSDFIIERKISMIKSSLKLSRPSVKLCRDPICYQGLDDSDEDVNRLKSYATKTKSYRAVVIGFILN